MNDEDAYIETLQPDYKKPELPPARSKDLLTDPPYCMICCGFGNVDVYIKEYPYKTLGVCPRCKGNGLALDHPDNAAGQTPAANKETV